MAKRKMKKPTHLEPLHPPKDFASSSEAKLDVLLENIEGNEVKTLPCCPTLLGSHSTMQCLEKEEESIVDAESSMASNEQANPIVSSTQKDSAENACNIGRMLQQDKVEAFMKAEMLYLKGDTVPSSKEEEEKEVTVSKNFTSLALPEVADMTASQSPYDKTVEEATEEAPVITDGQSHIREEETDCQQQLYVKSFQRSTSVQTEGKVSHFSEDIAFSATENVLFFLKSFGVLMLQLVFLCLLSFNLLIQWARKGKKSSLPAEKPTRFPTFASPSRELQEYTAASISGWQFVNTAPSKAYTEPLGSNIVHDFAGNQKWVYSGSFSKGSTLSLQLFNSQRTPNAADIPLRHALLHEKKIIEYSKSAKTVKECVDRGVEVLKSLQCPDGHWAGDYGGPHFLIPGFVIAAYAMDHRFEEHYKNGFIAYLRNHQQIDGGWGLHIEGPSMLFTTTLTYVTLRLLGCTKEETFMTHAREFIHTHGDATRVALWGKVLLASIGLFEWEGVPPIPIELSLLPTWVPISAGSLWCHSRVIFLPMAYLYSRKYQKPTSDLIESIKSEIFALNYDSIKWETVVSLDSAEIDVYVPVEPLTRVLLFLYRLYENYVASFKPFSFLKAMAETYVLKNIVFEDEFTNYFNLGPVNKAFNIIARVANDDADPGLQFHIKRYEDYLWLSEDGVKVQGEPGAQTWETSFAVLAITAESDMGVAHKECLEKSLKFLSDSQMVVPVENRSYYFRNSVTGGWGFTTSLQNWPVSDTTAEALMAVLKVQSLNGVTPLVSDKRLHQAVDLLLSMQNPCGGWSTYEPYRTGRFMEFFNYVEVFGDCMVDRPWTECTASCVVALETFRKMFPSYRANTIKSAITKGQSFILNAQMENGGWYGGWGVCFTYGTMFATKALQGEAARDARVQRAISEGCNFLLSHQKADGGWNETFESCLKYEYISSSSRGSEVVQTSWALLALLYGNCQDYAALKRAVRFIVSSQLSNGFWTQSSITGQFNCSTGITYSNYPYTFPVLALNEYKNSFGNEDVG